MLLKLMALASLSYERGTEKAALNKTISSTNSSPSDDSGKVVPSYVADWLECLTFFEVGLLI